MHNYYDKTSKRNCRILNLAILGLGYYEAITGILQWVGVLDSHHPGYAFTGTFYNPGPYACFLSIMLPIAVSMMDERNHRVERWAGTGMALICAILIPATLSRTALVACLVGGCVAMANLIAEKCKKWNKSSLVIAVAVLIAGGIGAYMVKKDSADGRMLMWKVAAQAAIGTPTTGVGWDNVAGAYGEAQENYFSSGKGTEKEKIVADAPEYVFNEYLQVAIAFGIPAAIFMVVLLAGGIIVAVHGRTYGLAGSAVSVAVVMMASYPLQFPLFVVAIGLVVMGCYLSSGSRWVNIAGSVLVISMFVLFLTHNNKTDVHTGFGIGHSLHNMREYRKSNETLLKLIHHSSDPMILNIIGKNYQSLGMPDSAEYYLKKSVNRCPNRLYPHYLLMNLYSDSVSYDKAKMIREAEILITKKEKIPSPAVDEMRDHALKTLNKTGK